MSEWISVKDRLPERAGRYLAYPSTIGEVCTALYSYLMSRNAVMWQDLEDHTEPWEPTHWMPLPEPPKEPLGDHEEEEEK